MTRKKPESKQMARYRLSLVSRLLGTALRSTMKGLHRRNRGGTASRRAKTKVGDKTDCMAGLQAKLPSFCSKG